MRCDLVESVPIGTLRNLDHRGRREAPCWPPLERLRSGDPHLHSECEQDVEDQKRRAARPREGPNRDALDEIAAQVNTIFAAQDRPGVLVNQNPFARRIKKAMAVAVVRLDLATQELRASGKTTWWSKCCAKRGLDRLSLTSYALCGRHHRRAWTRGPCCCSKRRDYFCVDTGVLK